MTKTANLNILLRKSLLESFQTPVMLVLANRIFEGYDIHQKTGYPRNIPIPPQQVAEQIVRDVSEANKSLEMVAELFNINDTGYMGRKYSVLGLNNIYNAIVTKGFIYDPSTHTFRENPRLRKSRNWGVLRPGSDYNVAMLKVDIVGNSLLVKKHDPKVIKKTYDDLHNIVTQIVEKRDGRVWYWEGDGGLGAFYSRRQHQEAALCAMEILHEVFFYNFKHNKLNVPLSIRTAVHGGEIEYSEDDSEIQKSDVFRNLLKIESTLTAPDTVSISTEIKTMLDSIVSNQFESLENNIKSAFRYELKWAK